MTEEDSAPPENDLFVVSPHATIRWRQRQLTLASGLHPVSLFAHAAVLSLLDFLSTPKQLRSIMAAELPILKAERRALIALLVRSGIVEVTRPPRTGESEIWWDPRDRAKYEAALMMLVQVAHGFSASARAGFCVDHWGLPVPWLARPVLDFLEQLDLSNTRVFEFGGGASTWYWARRCLSVTCVENNEKWFGRLRDALGSSVTVYLKQTAAEFANAILDATEPYDIVLVDAAPEFRSGCVGPALKRLAPGGLIILDDAPFYPEAASELRAAGLLEVDLTGYSPLEANFQTTSLFLQRGFDLPRRAGPSPAFPFGSPHFLWSDFSPNKDALP